MTSTADSPRRYGWLLAVTLSTFLVLLGSRSLNEPDEGRYAEVAREMVETGDWLVPHLWYAPHLDKPPLTYWAVAASILVLGQNEWAVRLPLALAGISGVWASYRFGRALGGQHVGVWSALILQSSLLYFVMARMLTTDIFLTQFIAWTVYFFWRSWRSLDEAEQAGVSHRTRRNFFAWHLAGWTAAALGFLTKGPIAVLVPLVCLATLWLCRWRDVLRRKSLFEGFVPGLMLFLVLVAPWFWEVFHRLPPALDFMVFSQALGHALGTTIKNRRGSPFYFFGILGFGFLPWTWLLGWLWRRAHWRKLEHKQREIWLLLSVWAVFTFTLFSLTRAKLPAYILPIFPALAALLAFRFFNHDPRGKVAFAPGWIWQLCLMSPLLLLAAVPMILPLAFRVELPVWMKWQVVLAVAGALLVWWLARHADSARLAGVTAGSGLLALCLIAAAAPSFETGFRSNQTLKPLGAALRANYQPGDKLVCWGRLPQGLPFYAYPVIVATNRPYFAGMARDQTPFRFPGNRDRLGDLVLPDEQALVRLLSENGRVLVVGFSGSFQHFEQLQEKSSLRLITRVGQWELFSNR